MVIPHSIPTGHGSASDLDAGRISATGALRRQVTTNPPFPTLWR